MAVSGANPPTGDIPGWKLVFMDDFDTDVASWGTCTTYAGGRDCPSLPAEYRSKWWAYPTSYQDTRQKVNGDGGYYNPANISCAGSMMTLRLRRIGGVTQSCAPTPKLPGALADGMTYGRWTVRWRARYKHATSVYKIAWLLFREVATWGEIDFPEGDLTGTISAFDHHEGGGQTGFDTSREVNNEYWNTSTVEWSPGLLRFILNDKEIGREEGANVPSQRMSAPILQSETILSGSVPTDAIDGYIDVDWIAVFERSSATTVAAKLPGNVVFDAGWESGTLLRGSSVTPRGFNGSSGSPSIVTGVSLAGGIPSGYTHGARFQVDNTKYDGFGDRSEVQGSTNEVEGQTRWYRWSFFLPADFPALSNFQVMGQWHSSANGSPPLAFYLDGGTYLQMFFNLANGSSEPRSIFRYAYCPWRTLIAPLKGKWTEIVMKIIWGSTDSTGQHELWLNGQKQTFNGPDANGQYGSGGGTQVFKIRNTDPGRSHYYKQGYYRGHTSALNPVTVYYAGFQITDGAGGGTVTFPGGGGGGGGTPPVDPTPGPVTAASATAGNTLNTLQWSNPPAGTFNEVFVKWSTSAYPNVYTEGSLLFSDTTDPYLTTYSHTGLVNGTPVYYSIFTRYQSGGTFYFSTPVKITATPSGGAPAPPTPPAGIPATPDARDVRLGFGTPANTWGPLQANSIRGSASTLTERRKITHYRALVRGQDDTAETQAFRMCLYRVTGSDPLAWPLVAGSLSAEVTVAGNSDPVWANLAVTDFDVDAGVYVPALISGSPVRLEFGYAIGTPLYFANDTYSDSPAATWGAQASGVVGSVADTGLCAYAVTGAPIVPSPTGPVDPAPATRTQLTAALSVALSLRAATSDAGDLAIIDSIIRSLRKAIQRSDAAFPSLGQNED